MAGEFRSYTLARYNGTILRVARLRWIYAAAIVVSVLATTVLFPRTTGAGPGIAGSLVWLTVAWLLPPPLLGFSAYVYFRWFRPERFLLDPPAGARAATGAARVVIFQITTTGENIETVVNSARSVLYWTRRQPNLGYVSLLWIVCEEFGYEPNRAAFDALREEGARVIVTPREYRTPRGTTRKGRALQYSVEIRRKAGLPLDRVWVYHQDDETAVGEDTVLGIHDFLERYGDAPAVGCGTILYPQHGEDLRPSMIQELGRTQDDVRTIFTMTSRYNAFSGFHGSHYLARADVEDATGFDIGPNMTSEDLIFEVRARARHGNIFRLLKGFAYEQAAFSLTDQIRQRRRWFQGWWKAVRALKFPLGRRIVMTYGMLVWMTGLLSFVAMAASWVFGFRPLFVFSGSVSGFVWSLMAIRYEMGYEFHRAYLAPRTVSRWRILPNAVLGAFSDAIVPWYGTFTRQPRTFQVIRKDSRRPAGVRGPAVPAGT
jgi:egghead protein (zeste-white 4 protein)